MLNSLDPKQKSIKNFLKPTNKNIFPHQNDPDYQILSIEAHIPIKMIDGKQEAFLTYEEISKNGEEKNLALVISLIVLNMLILIKKTLKRTEIFF